MSFPTTPYAPSGYNDNNQNRPYHPSNIFPANGGYLGNPNSQFNPITTNSMKTMDLGKFPTAYIPTTPIIDKIDYRNKNDVLHNNLGLRLLDEQINEYRLVIDSLDRDISVYSNPYEFTIHFNTSGPEYVQTEEYIDYKNKKKGTKIVETRFNASPSPLINKEFVNVKYVRLENIILPKHNKIIEVDGVWIFDPDSEIFYDRFIALNIKELNMSERVFSTSSDITRNNGKEYTPEPPFAIIVPDKVFGRDFYIGNPNYGSKVYKDSKLGTIKKLTLEFTDSLGIPLKIDGVFTYDQLCCYEYDTGEKLPITDLRHPQNPLLQPHLSIVIGVVEAELNTDTQFAR